MKRFFTLCMALLFAGSAFAQEVKEENKGPEFKYGFKGSAFGVTGAQSDFAYDYAHIRVRPTFSLGNENVKGVVTFEIDQDYGKGADSSYGDPGTDNQVVEVKHAYVEVKDAVVPKLSLMTGLNGYKFPLVVDNDFAIFQAGYDFGMGKAVVSFIKVEEQDKVENDETDTEDADDVDVYALDLPLNLGAIKVRPGLMSIKGGDQSTYAEASLMNYAINVNGDMGIVAFNATGAYLSGDINATTETSAYAFDANVDVKPVDGVKVGAFFTYGTGNDGSDATEDNGYFYNMNMFMGKNETSGTAGKTSSGAPDGRLFLLENASLASGGGINYFDVMDNDYGWMSYGLYAEAKFGKLTAFAQFGMASLVEDSATGDTAVGSELDVRLSYEVAPKTTVFAEYANFMAGDDLGIGKYADAEGAYQLAWGLSTSI